MPVSPAARGWFERGVFDLAIAKAHLQNRLWKEAAMYARQSATKCIQALLVKTGAPEPSPRMSDLLRVACQRESRFLVNEAWITLDRFASGIACTQAESEQAYDMAEAVRDAVARFLDEPDLASGKG